VTRRDRHEVDEADERLRAAFRAREPRAGERVEHPSGDDLWAAVRGELGAERRRAIVDHTAACAACAEAWRLAVEMAPEGIPAVVPRVARARPAFHWLAPLAAAAAVAVAVGAGLWQWRAPGSVPAYRGGGAGEVQSLVGDGEALPRDDFRLRWSAGPEGSRYDLRVTTESLEVVADAAGLAETSYVVPPSALSAVPSGGRVLWRVEVAPPDGGRTASRTFVTRVR
jgi:hypothetical protein